MEPNQVEKAINRIGKALSIVAGTALALMMFLMAADVVCRYLFNAPIPGALELVEYMMAVSIPLSIAFCTAIRSHVSVEMIVEKLPTPLERAISFIVTLLMVAFLVILSRQSFLNIIDSYQSNITSAVLKIPAYPFTIPVALGMSCYALFLVLHYFFGKRS